MQGNLRIPVKCEKNAMSTDRKIFSMDTLEMKQKRAQKLGYVNFVDEFTINFASEILSDINRRFNQIAIIGREAKIWGKGLGLKDVVSIDATDELNFNNKKFDLVIHALSLHRCNDPIGQLIQVRQALKVDGLMLAFFMGGNTLQELRESFEAAEIRVESGISPRVAPMIEIRDAGNLLVRAGFALSVADRTDLIISYGSPIDLFYDLRRMGETSIMVDRQKSFLRRDTLNECLEIYSKNFAIPKKNQVKATFQLLCLTGWAPADHQQKPLKPGSASHHFSEVLGTFKL